MAAGAAGLLLATAPATAQLPPLDVPQASPAASVSQRIGLTDITVTYHRPAVNKREIWGKLVPYGETWRAVPDYPAYRFSNLGGQVVVIDAKTSMVVAIY